VGATSTVVRDVVCPFCSLGCDDLQVAVDGTSLHLMTPDCPAAADGFARPAMLGPPSIAGEPATLEAASARAADILRSSSLPLFGGLGTDVAGMREVLALAERAGGIVDHAGSPGLLANLRATQDGGWVTTTLAEVRNRADLVLLVGTDTKALAPRLAERCFAPTGTLFGPIERRLIHLGPGPALSGAEILPCRAEELGEVLAVLRALVASSRISGETVAGVPLASLRELAASLQAARYPVIVWAARDLPGGHPDLLIGTLAGLIRDLNAKGRCVGLPLVGADNPIGANQVCGWQTGGPLRTSFASGGPDYDPVRWAATAVLAAGAADCLVWIASIGTQSLPDWAGPTVALVWPGHPLPRPVDVAIPVGTPGVDQAGSVYRMDGVVSLPLRALRQRELPSVAEVLRRFRALL
jgi:formylmethanofuran dehydrogenase subunit B